MTRLGRIITSNTDLGLVNQTRSETSAERTIVRREKIASELYGGALNDFYSAVCNRDFIPIGKEIFYF